MVAWDDHTGQRQQRAFGNLEDALLEAAYLEREHDYVAIIDETEV